MNKNNNPLGLQGIQFVEFSSPQPEKLEVLFSNFGFSNVMRHRDLTIDLYKQNQIDFLLNNQKNSFSDSFQKLHGPSISSMGWKFDNPANAYQKALEQGARPANQVDYKVGGKPVPAIYGIGDSLIYFVPADGESRALYEDMGFTSLQDPKINPTKGFICIDHLTNNVYKGTMEEWSNFYKNIFGFEEVRYFDIKGEKTGLTSYALKSPCGSFCIPINEADEEKSQINEYLQEYHGPGIQHLAFLTEDILNSLKDLEGTGIKMLDIAPDYYKKVFNRVPGVREDKELIEKYNVLVDGDKDGYLLQIFTKNLVGPIFIEIIQRNNHLSFGEGNFQALFESIERDQMKRGVL